MKRDYKTFEKDEPNFTFTKERSKNNTEWLDELINKIENMKNKISNTF